ncbi:3-phosphoshikimate 1-carboxyvinyltransferase [Candidatus Peregrinibacteria bacterium]|nr:3-phosphoshikimate 1-carboxyvinyltransferase [Candidatus Peregrinibacteria bacterium]
MMEIKVPGSKSITNRALIASSLAKGKSILTNALESEDTRHMMRALKNLGIKIKREKNNKLKICGGNFKKAKKTLFCGNSGTVMRFLAAVLALQNFESVLDGDKRMRRRPIKDLLDALQQLGANVKSLKQNGFSPIKISGPAKTGHCYINGNISSQFLSGLLLASPFAPKDTTIHVIGRLVSKPYVDMTIDVMEKFGVKVKRNGYKKFFISSGQRYQPLQFKIEGDASSATYFWGISQLTGEEIKITNIPEDTKQPDIRMKVQSSKFKVQSYKSKLKTIKIDCTDFPDGAITLAVLCAFNKGKFILTGLKNLRVKECNRLSALAAGLKKIGCHCRKLPYGLIIFGDPEKLHGGRIETYADHRIAMCFGMAKFVLPGIKIENPACVKKTYPNFWKDLAGLKKHFQKKNIVLTGMRGSGKTRLGRLLGRLLGRRFIDTDELIEQNSKMPIALLVKKRGWDYFRRLERNIVQKLRNEKNAVIATGGGTFLNTKNTEILKRNGKVIFLDSSINSLKKRLEDKTDRPSLTGKKDFLKELNEVYLKRLKTYNSVADAVLDVSQQTNNKQRDLEKKLQKLTLICTRFGII